MTYFFHFHYYHGQNNRVIHFSAGLRTMQFQSVDFVSKTHDFHCADAINRLYKFLRDNGIAVKTRRDFGTYCKFYDGYVYFLTEDKAQLLADFIKTL